MINRETDMNIERDNLRRFHQLYAGQSIRFPDFTTPIPGWTPWS